MSRRHLLLHLRRTTADRGDDHRAVDALRERSAFTTHRPRSLSLSRTVIFTLCTRYRMDFRDTYALVGLWNSFFLIIYSFLGVSKIMKWSTR